MNTLNMFCNIYGSFHKWANKHKLLNISKQIQQHCRKLFSVVPTISTSIAGTMDTWNERPTIESPSNTIATSTGNDRLRQVQHRRPQVRWTLADVRPTLSNCVWPKCKRSWPIVHWHFPPTLQTWNWLAGKTLNPGGSTRLPFSLFCLQTRN